MKKYSHLSLVMRSADGDEPLTAVALREVVFAFARIAIMLFLALREEHVMRNYPSQVEQGGRRFRRAQVSLHQRGHRHACRAHRLLAGPRVTIHGSQGGLHLFIEQLVPVVSQERKELSCAAKALENRFFLTRICLARDPALDGHVAERITAAVPSRSSFGRPRK